MRFSKVGRRVAGAVGAARVGAIPRVIPSVVVVVGCVACGAAAYADDLEQELRATVQKMRQELQKDGTLTGDAARRVEEIEKTVPIKRSDSDAVGMKVLSHLRGAQGVSFPTAEEVVVEPRPTARPTPRVAKIFVPPKPYQRPSKCESGGTTRSVLYKDVPEGEVVYDVLYISEDLVPFDITEVYGKKVDVYPYGQNSPESVYIRMEVHNVPCVPYRFRMTHSAMYEDRGINALRNYDKEPAGKGELHPWVSSKLFGQAKE